MSRVLAIFLGILAYSIFNIGLVLQKSGADKLPVIEKTSAVQNVKNFLGNREWLVGFILTNLQWVFFILALSMAPLSTITPLLGVGIVVLTIFSHFYLHEKIKQVEITSIVIIIVGIVLIGISALDETSKTVEEMFTLFGAPISIIFLIGVSIAAGIPCAYSISKDYKISPAIIFGIAAGVGAGIGATFSKGVSSGVDDIFIAAGNGLWWIMLGLMLVGNVVSLVLLQIGFQKGKAVIVGPIFNVLVMILPVISGVIILGEWSAQTPSNIALQIMGLLTITVGIIILSFFGEKKKSAENE